MSRVSDSRPHPQVRVPRPTIRQPHRGRGVWRWLLAILLLAAVAALALWSFWYGVARSETTQGALRAQVDELTGKNEALSAERDELLQRVTTLERGAKVDREAAEMVRKSLVELQDERLELKEEVALLTSLVASGKSRSGLRARRLVLEPLEEAGSYRFRFALSKSPQDDEEVRVKVELSVVGVQDGKSKTLDMKALAVGELEEALKFKQLIQVEGTLKLPPDFEPEILEVSARPNQDDVLGVEREFPWKVE